MPSIHPMDEAEREDRAATSEQLEAFIKRAGFTWGWENLESWARRMAEQGVEERNAVEDLLAQEELKAGIYMDERNALAVQLAAAELDRDRLSEMNDKLTHFIDTNPVQSVADLRTELVAYVDALREATKKMTCARCGWNVFRVMTANNCPDCAALRAIFQEPQP